MNYARKYKRGSNKNRRSWCRKKESFSPWGAKVGVGKTSVVVGTGGMVQ